MSGAAPSSPAGSVVIGLAAVIFALDGERPAALTVRGPAGGDAPAALPFGPFDPAADRTFEIALRAFVDAQTGFDLGYVEQLYTFGDQGRDAPTAAVAGAPGARVVSVGYLALAHDAAEAPGGAWADWYRFFPWEDWRSGRPEALDAVIAPRLRAWADDADGQGRRAARWERARVGFGLGGAQWNEERVLDRYELLYEAGLAPERAVDDGAAPPVLAPAVWGARMASDHRRILATAISRLRAKVRYRPVIFELLPDRFTLSDLQRGVETILGQRLHKQNFRRALHGGGLVEGTGQKETATGGRPAELFRFRREALRERPALGVPAPRLPDPE